MCLFKNVVDDVVSSDSVVVDYFRSFANKTGVKFFFN